MNDMTYSNSIHEVAVDQAGTAGSSSHFLTDQLEHLWLLSALQQGIEQAKRGETLVADQAFFDALQSRLFDGGKEEVVIQA